jgi:hypothetical protein
MNSKLKLVLITAALLVLAGSSARSAYPGGRPERAAQSHGNETASSKTDANKTTPTDYCSLLTRATIEKTLGQPLEGNPKAQKEPPMYVGAQGWSCTYYVGPENHGRVKVNLSIEAQASPANAKQDFDKLAIGADVSKGRPSIGDSAFWFDSKAPYIWVLKGKFYFSIEIDGGTEKQAKELAAAVAARM